MDARSDESVRFDDPPVQQVILSIYCEAMIELSVVDVLALFSRWSEDYPHLSQELPADIWDNSGRNAIQQAISEGTHWPLPLLTIIDADGAKSIRVQEDRFELVWRSQPGESYLPYVGYTRLRQELLSRFSDFSSFLAGGPEITVKPRRVDATYNNYLDAAPSDVMVGMLTNWQVDSASPNLPNKYSNLHLHDTLTDDKGQVQVIVYVDPGPDGSGTDWTIDVQCRLEESGDPIARLDDAHKHVIETFLTLSGPELRQKWGEK